MTTLPEAQRNATNNRLPTEGSFELYALMEQPYNKYYTVKDEIIEIGTDLKALNTKGKALQRRFPGVDGLNEHDVENEPYNANFCFGGGAGVMTIAVEKLSKLGAYGLMDMMTPKSLVEILERYLPTGMRVDVKVPKEFLAKCVMLLAAQEPHVEKIAKIEKILSMEDGVDFLEIAYFDADAAKFICTMKVNKKSKTKKTMKCPVSKEDIKQGDMIIGFNAKLDVYDCPTW
jgi:hypothetical protein